MHFQLAYNDIANIDCLQSIKEEALANNADVIEFDFGDVSDILPFTACYCAAFADELIRLGKYPRFLCAENNQAKFEQIGLDTLHLNTELREPFLLEQTLRPVYSSKIKIVNDYIYFLKSIYAIPSGVLKATHSIIHDLLMNVIQHSKSNDRNYFCADIIDAVLRICVLDSGIGIRKSLINRYQDLKNDLAAIEKCLEYGVTNIRDSQRGIGLTVIKRMALDANGEMELISGNGKLIIRPSETIKQDIGVTYFGTIISVKLKVDPLYRPRLDNFENGIEG
ncbi:MAG: sensor histidine kinase [Calditrichaeota bacterium]|nr:sensor histidine kinase [Calditrichota bacterium]